MIGSRTAWRLNIVCLTSTLALSAAVGCFHESSSPQSSPLRLRFLGDFNIRTGTPLEDVEPPDFGGISGLAFAPKANELYALSDARRDCRFYILDLVVNDGQVAVTPRSVRFLRGRDGALLGAGVMDPEGIVRAADGTLYVSSEGVQAGAPGLYLFGPDGVLLREIPVPTKFLPGGQGRPPRGVRENLAFEGLALSPDGTRLFVAAEQALVQDDELTSPTKGSRTRIIEYAVGDRDVDPVREVVYELDPVAKPDGFAPGEGENGLAELVALDVQQLLALERSFFVEEGDGGGRRSHQQIRIYFLSLVGASDVSAAESLRQVPEARPVKKLLVLDLEDIVSELDPEFPTLDNFEGMCFGPRLENGSRTLVLVSDNNFRRGQRTVFLVFEMLEDQRTTRAGSPKR